MLKSLAFACALLASGSALAKDIWVGPAGQASAAGTAAAPLASIQAAVNLAQAGDVVHLLPGTYFQDIQTVRSGASGATITITGPQDAVVKGGGKAHVVEISHDWISLTGFTVDGWWQAPTKTMASYRSKLIYVVSKTPGHGVEHLNISGMWVQNAGGECIRMRYLVRSSTVRYNRISTCGVYAFQYAAGGKNGEGIYLGTAPEQRADGTNPTADVDVSSKNLIAYNLINTQGNECVDIKEGATGNRVERNTCTGQTDPDSGGFDSRGSANIFRENVSFGNAGVGIRLGGDGTTDGINNIATGNVLMSNAGGSFKIMRLPQGAICGNTVSDGALVRGITTTLKPEAACP